MYFYALTERDRSSYEGEHQPVFLGHSAIFTAARFRELVAEVAPAAWCALVQDAADGKVSKNLTMYYPTLQDYLARTLAIVHGFVVVEPLVTFSPYHNDLDANSHLDPTYPALCENEEWLDGHALTKALVNADCFDDPTLPKPEPARNWQYPTEGQVIIFVNATPYSVPAERPISYGEVCRIANPQMPLPAPTYVVSFAAPTYGVSGMLTPHDETRVLPNMRFVCTPQEPTP